MVLIVYVTAEEVLFYFAENTRLALCGTNTLKHTYIVTGRERKMSNVVDGVLSPPPILTKSLAKAVTSKFHLSCCDAVSFTHSFCEKQRGLRFGRTALLVLCCGKKKLVAFHVHHRTLLGDSFA